MESKKNNNDFEFYKNISYKIIIVILLILFFIYVKNFVQRKPTIVDIKVASTTISAQVADTENKRSLGLSYTDKLSENQQFCKKAFIQ